MHPKLTINIYSVQGKRSLQSFYNALASFGDKDVTVTLQLKRRGRSNSQNAYLWGVIYKILQQCFLDSWGERYTIEQVHDFCKVKFNSIEKVNTDTGEVIYIPRSTTQNSTTAQEEYHQLIREFALEWFNTVIPLPNEELEINFEK